MNIETLIKSSAWWQAAVEMPDRHYDPSAGISLADHLNAVEGYLRFLQPFDGEHAYFAQLREALTIAGFDLLELRSLLSPVAWLHDIGKSREDKSAEGVHPVTGKTVPLRHPIVGVIAAVELLPEAIARRMTILALIEEHDTPYGWYRQFQRSGEVPKPHSWSKLDRKIDPQGAGNGLIPLAVFKLADIDGHDDVSDVAWFIEQANINVLDDLGKPLPVPEPTTIRSLTGS